ncbi:HNH endonuclease [Paenibacillus xylanilyticus]|uniref:HNH endonuclease n=1 Tax=Paenibacillus xylanilyticus TaxID=248903 RepID=UPI0039A1AF19
MRNLNRPEVQVEDVYSTCVRQIRNKQLRRRLEDCLSDVIEASDRFAELAEESKVYTFKDYLCEKNEVTIDEMKEVYNGRMAAKKSRGRVFYDKLMSSPFNFTCPLCGQRKVSQLDHVLPKAEYPSLVVTPDNLVPSCPECNKKKLDKTPTSSEEETLHPYFDDLGSERFLFASISSSKPASIYFYIHPRPDWTEQKATRVEYHFKFYELNTLYCIHVIDEIAAQAAYWDDLSMEVLKEEMKRQAKSRIKHNPNSWQSAFYEGMAENEWFCNKGYNELLY